MKCKDCEHYYPAPTPEEIVPWCEKYDKKLLHASRWCELKPNIRRKNTVIKISKPKNIKKGKI